MKIAITGATGQLGRLIVESLKQKTSPENLVALVRTPEKAKDLGIETRAFDYSKIENQVEALKGIDTLLLISGSEVGQREQQHKNVINSAKEAGIKSLVYTSLLHLDTSSLSLATEHTATEKAIYESGITHTILRNGWYTENYAASIPSALQNGAFIGAAADGKIASATRKDYAEAAAVILSTEGHNNKVYELAGDDAYTLTEFAAELSNQTGKNIPYKNFSEAEFTEILEGAGLPKAVAEMLASSDAGAAKGDLFDDSKTLSKLIGRATTPFSAVIKETLS